MKSFFNRLKKQKSAYLDFAATTPVDKRVVQAMSLYWSQEFFNASSSYRAALSIKKKIKEARKIIAQFVGVKENEIIYTQGGTESINLALIGLIKKVQLEGIKNPHVLVSTIEHPAVLECIEHIQTLGAQVEYIPVLSKGIIDIQAFEKLLKPETVLISIITASNETGIIQPIHKISSIVKKFKNSLHRSFEQMPYVHTDASQIALVQDIHISRFGVDMMTIDGSKIYAPKMSGILIKKSYIELEPVIYGGGQEYGLRSGTEATPQIIGITKALELVYEERGSHIKKFHTIKKYFIELLDKTSIIYEINGTEESVPHILNICIPGLQSDFAVIQLDEYGVQCASMTSCAGSKGLLKSRVLEAMNKFDCAESSLRFSFGKTTTKSEIKKAVRALVEVCKDQRVI